MNNEQVNDELQFLLQLKEFATQILLETSINTNKLPAGFDVIKGIDTLNRVMNAEVEYLKAEPGSYFNIYK